ncbi:MAG TPA: hypothetical protein VFA74_15520 [Terriglobales bacterium]|nr:hypothetical protein [Terriglobales bacterium]
MTGKPSTNLSGTVEKIIKSVNPADPEKVEIAVEQAEHLYREVRVENKLTNSDGETVKLKPGAQVDIVIEADREHTTKPDEPEKD